MEAVAAGSVERRRGIYLHESALTCASRGCSDYRAHVCQAQLTGCTQELLRKGVQCFGARFDLIAEKVMKNRFESALC